jgi:HEAT repeat protein
MNRCGANWTPFVKQGILLGLLLTLSAPAADACQMPSGTSDPRPAEVLLKGKPLAFWMSRLGDTKVEHRREAAHVLQYRGLEILPTLPALIKAVEDDDREVRIAVLDALRTIGRPARDAIPGILRQMQQNDCDYYARAVWALRAIGHGDERIIMALAKGPLQPRRFEQQYTVLYEAIPDFGPKAKAAIPLLKQVLKDPNPQVRYHVVRTLGRLGAKGAVPVAEALQDKDSFVRRAAVEGLEDLGRDAQEALPILKKVLKDADTRTRSDALGALAKGAPEVVAALESAPEPPDLMTRRAVVAALGNVKPPAKDALPRLAAALKDPGMREAAFHSLEQLGPPAAPVLAKALGEPATRVRALKILQALGPKAKEAIPVLIEALKSDNEDLQQRARVIVIAIGTPAVNGLLEAARDPDNEQAYQLLVNVGTDSPAVVPAMRKMLEDSDPEMRRRAEEVLGGLGRVAKEATPALIAALKDRNPSVQRQAAQALQSIDPERAAKELKH